MLMDCKESRPIRMHPLRTCQPFPHRLNTPGNSGNRDVALVADIHRLHVNLEHVLAKLGGFQARAHGCPCRPST